MIAWVSTSASEWPSRPRSCSSCDAAEHQPPAARRSDGSHSRCPVITTARSVSSSSAHAADRRGGRDLQVPRVRPRTTRTTPPARSISHASSVAWASSVVASGQRPLERGAAEHLRRLNRPQPRAVERALHGPAVVADLLDRVGHRRRRDHRIGSASARAPPAPARTARRGQRPGGVVDDHRVAVARGRAAPRAPTASGAAPPATAIVPAGACVERVGGQRDDDPIARRRTAPQRVDAPLQHRRARKARRAPWAGRTQGARHVPRPRSTRPPSASVAPTSAATATLPLPLPLA